MEKIDLECELDSIYERWLLEEYPDKIHTKEQLLEASRNQFHWEEWTEAIKKYLG